MGFKLAELFVPIRLDMAPMSGMLRAAHGQLLGLAGAATAATLSFRGAFLALAGFGAPVGYAVKQAIDLEHQYAQIRKTTGLAGAEFDALKSGLKGLATTMAGVSLDEVNGIAEMAGRLGIQGVDGILGYTKAIASITIALDDIPAEEAATSIARILNVFHLGPEAALSFASALNKLDDSSTATGRDILDVAQRLSGAAATLGLSPQKVVALAAAVKDAGIENEVAGSAFSQVLSKMAVDTAKFAKVAGVSTKEFAGTLRGDPLAALKAFIGGLKGMEKLEQFKALDQLGFDGVRTSGSLLQLGQVIRKLDGFVADANSEWKTHASIEREVAIRARETGAQLQLLWNQARLAAEGIGANLLPVVRKLAEAMGEVAAAVRGSVADQDAAIGPWVQGMIDAIETAQLVWRNWGDIIEHTGVRIAGEIDHIQTVIGAFIGWLKDNFASGIAPVLAAPFKFVAAEIGNMVAVAKEAIAVIQSGFQKEFKPKLADPLAAIKGLDPKFHAFHMPGRDPAFGDMLRQIEDRMADRELKALEDKARRGAGGPGKAPEPKKEAEGTGKAPVVDKAKPVTEDLSSYVKRLQEGVFGKDEKKKQTELLQQNVNVNKQILNAVKNAPAQPGFAVGPE